MKPKVLVMALTALGAALPQMVLAADALPTFPEMANQWGQAAVYTVTPYCQVMSNGMRVCQPVIRPAPSAGAPGGEALTAAPLATLGPQAAPGMANPYLPNPYLMPNPYLAPYAPPAGYMPPGMMAQPMPAQFPFPQFIAPQPAAAQPAPVQSAAAKPVAEPAPAAAAPVTAAVQPPAAAQAVAAKPAAEPAPAVPATAAAQPPATVQPVPVQSAAAKPVAEPAPAAAAPATAAVQPPAAAPGRPAAKPAATVAVEDDMVIVHFDFDSAVLDNSGRLVLDSWLMLAPKDKTVRITGHADRLGSDAYNMLLSARRAEAVKRYLTEKGMKAGQMQVVAKGEKAPLVHCKGSATPATKACLAPNRRVEVDPQ